MKKSTSLPELLCQIKDNRRKQGTRHSLENILLTVIIGTMSGYYGYRGMEDFCARYKDQLCEVLGRPKHGIASYSSIRRVLMDLDFNVLSSKFYQWVRGRVKIKKKEWLQVDGKSIKGTVCEHDSRYQNFISLVSLFLDRTGIALKVYQMENWLQSEITVVQKLVTELELRDIVISMDALHCKKNSC
jgi:DDE_Tnp_1-associated